jgi:hypothetical protein
LDSPFLAFELMEMVRLAEPGHSAARACFDHKFVKKLRSLQAKLRARFAHCEEIGIVDLTTVPKGDHQSGYKPASDQYPSLRAILGDEITSGSD